MAGKRWWLMVTSVTAFLVALAGCIAALIHVPNPDADRNSPGSPQHASPTLWTAPVGDADDDVPEGPAALTPSLEAVEVAVEFVRQWGHHPKGETAAQWHRRLAPYVTEDLAKNLKTTDVATAPTAKIESKPTSRSSSTSAVDVIVPTTLGRIGVTCLRIGNEWKIAQFDRIE